MLDFINHWSVPLIALFTAVFIGYNNWRKSDNTIDDRLISNYKTLDEQQKIQLTDKDDQIKKYQNDMGEIKASMSNLKENFAKETGKLQGQIDAKDKELASLRLTILNPSLDLGKILTEIHDFMEALTKSNIHQVSMLEKQVKDELDIAHRDRNLESGRKN